DRLGHVREELKVQRLDPLAEHEEEDHDERHQGEQHREAAKSDQQRRLELAPGGVVHTAAASVTSATAALAAFGLRFMLQIKLRDIALTMSVMMKRTRPISTSALK